MPGVGRQKLSVKSDSVQNPLAFAERIPPVKVFALDFRPGLVGRKHSCQRPPGQDGGWRFTLGGDF
jgi:hypothetical protein